MEAQGVSTWSELRHQPAANLQGIISSGTPSKLSAAILRTDDEDIEESERSDRDYLLRIGDLDPRSSWSLFALSFPQPLLLHNTTGVPSASRDFRSRRIVLLQIV